MVQKTLGWRPNKKQIIYGLLALVVVLLVIMLTRFDYACDWTGFGQCPIPVSTGQEVRREKTLWDFLELIIVPLALIGVGVWFNRQEKIRDLENAKRTQIAAFREARRRAAYEDKRQADDQREEALQSYLDRMATLLIDEELRTTRKKGVLQVARSRSLTLLGRLDKKRKISVIKFLYEAELIYDDNTAVGLYGAPLRAIDLRSLTLGEVNLSSTDLREADFEDVHLSQANLSYADLRWANFRKVYLLQANLVGAKLQQADLQEANLQGARPQHSELEDADLTGAIYDAYTEWPDGFDPQAAGAILKEDTPPPTT